MSISKKLTLSDVERMIFILNGGKGSGNFGHKGRPGEIGGSGPGGGSTKYSNLYDRLLSEGGFTYQPTYDISPKDGFMVSPYQDREKVIATKNLSHKDLRAYVNKNADLLGKNDHYLGGWVYEGNCYLDVSIRAETKETANKIAKDNAQIAFFDLKNKIEIKTNILNRRILW